MSLTRERTRDLRKRRDTLKACLDRLAARVRQGHLTQHRYYATPEYLEYALIEELLTA